MSFRHGRDASRRLAVIGPLVLATLGLAPFATAVSADSIPAAFAPSVVARSSGGDALASAAGAASTSSPGATEAAMRLRAFDRLNADRVAAGLLPLRSDAILQSVAEPRAGRMAAAGVLSHSVAGGDIGAAVGATGVRWYTVAEDIGYSTAAWGSTSIDWIVGAWENSPEHRAIMLDDRMNYVGVGLAESASGTTFASLVFAETDDRTAPSRRLTGAHLDGRTATFTWTGRDIQLQTHTSGLANFDVAYRIDGGAWRVIRSATTATSLVLRDRLAGHAYAIRIRTRDRAGNVSTWSSARRLVVR